MKRILSLMAAVLMALTLAGCETPMEKREKQAEKDSKDLQERIDSMEYEQEAGDLVKNYLTSLNQYSNDVNTFIADWDTLVTRTDTFLKTANGYLSMIESLDPPSEDKSFHQDLLEWVSFARDYNKAFEAMTESPDSDKIAEANNKVISAATKLDSKMSELKAKENWFKKAAESAGF